ncbi:hypothetical protein FA014_01025 [Cellulomonas hominis]|uniref:PepSY domain-containing protein n=1 Tax=Cellulomonas hominis TaxID=156981 RepID=A0A7Z8K282_9CELL|nr:hypothetical protein [Cellulomonas hominis]TKR27312.1 hypothetical protein FA014_01025 [Cellulomonas hominis]
MTWPDRHGTQVVQPAVTAPATPVTPGTATTSPPDLTDRGSATADELIAAIDTAVAAAQGRGAECIEVHRGGFLVTVQLADGADVDVVVPSTGAAEVRHQRDDRDRTPSPLLNPDDIHKLVDVAREASAGATLIELSTSDDPGEAFEAVALRADGHQFEISITDAMVATVTDVEDSRD